MKTLGHILIILITAFAVIGAAYVLSQTTLVSALVGQPMDGGAAEERSAPQSFTTGQGAPADEVGGRPEGGLEGLARWQTLGQNLLKMAVIVAAVQLLWSIGRRLKLLSTALVRKNRFHPGHTS